MTIRCIPDFKPDKFSDEYQEQLRELIAAKLEQGDALDTAATFGEADDGGSDDGKVVDLMEALRRSVEENRAKRTASKTPAKKVAAKKTAAKKSTATKSTAKKSTAKKAAAKKKSA